MSTFDHLLEKQTQINLQLRAAVVDWLFEVGSKLRIDDKYVIFQAVSLMDRFYEQQSESMPANDLQLTAVTALFISSKNLEVEPLRLQTCVQELCFDKYEALDFIEKETQIRLSTEYQNDIPLMIDFMLLFMRLLRNELQSSIDCM